MRDLKAVLKYLKQDKFNFFMATSLIVVETIFELIIPFIMKDIINDGVLKSDMTVILKSGIYIIVCALVSLLTGHFYSIFNARMISNYTYNLRKDLFNHVQKFSFSNLDNFNTTSLVTRITNDCQIMQNSLAGAIRPLFRSPILLLMGIGLSFIMAPTLAWIFVMVIPFLALILFFVVKKTASKYKIIQENVDELNLVVRENVTAIRTVKSYVREDYEINKFKKANEKTRNETVNTFKVATLNTPSFQFSMYLVSTLLLAFGAIKVHNNTLQVGSLSALLSYVLQVMNSIIMISNVFLLMNRSFASAKRINEVLSEKPSMESLDTLKVSKGDILFKDVYFKYKEKSQEYVLQDINLNIYQGMSLGIMGGTGSAKSSLVSLMLRLYDVTSGEVLIDGKNIKNYDLKNLRDSIAIVLQNNVLFKGSVRDNLLWGNENATDDEINEALKISCSDEFIDRLPGGLNYDVGQGGVGVSGGQRQRLCIARALLKNPKIIIFDDSTSACDMETERKILGQIRTLKNVTNITIAQRVRSVMDCDEIIILDEGKIVARGNHETLLKNSKIYKELCDVQLGGAK